MISELPNGGVIWPKKMLEVHTMPRLVPRKQKTYPQKFRDALKSGKRGGAREKIPNQRSASARVSYRMTTNRLLDRITGRSVHGG
jgi:hypothetical protein